MRSFIWYWYWPVIILLIALRGAFWLGAYPNPDEAYYWLWGQHPAWSYFDHPPLHAWIQGGMAMVWGRSHGVLRLPTILSTSLLFSMYGLICRRLYGQQHQDGFWLTVLLVLTSPLLFLFLALAWHDHWLICLGTAASYCLVEFLSGDRRAQYGWLYGAGILIGLAGLCKYVALFLGVGWLVAIAGYSNWRHLLGNPHLYGAMAIALLITAPVMGWNSQHEFYSFQFYLGRSVQAESQAMQWWGPAFFGGLSGIIFGPFHTGLALKATQYSPPSSPFATAYRRLAWTVFGVSTAALAVLSLKAPVLYYWNILAYPLLLPLMAGCCLDPDQPRQLHHARWLQGANWCGCGVTILLVVHHAILPLPALVADSGDNDTRMLYGWSQIAATVSQQTARLSSPLVLTTDYRSASALAYELNDASVMALSGRIDQFDFWYDAAAMDGHDALLLGDRWHPICPTHLAMFDHTDPPETLTIKRLGVFIKDYTLVRGYDFQSRGPNADPLSPEYPLAFTSDGERCQ